MERRNGWKRDQLFSQDIIRTRYISCQSQGSPDMTVRPQVGPSCPRTKLACPRSGHLTIMCHSVPVQVHSSLVETIQYLQSEKWSEVTENFNAGQIGETVERSLNKAYKPIVRNNESKMVPNMVDIKNVKKDSEIEYFWFLTFMVQTKHFCTWYNCTVNVKTETAVCHVTSPTV